MSEVVATSAPQWFWTDDLARVLQDAGRPLGPPLDGWLSTPTAVRASGAPLEVAQSLLEATDAIAAA